MKLEENFDYLNLKARMDSKYDDLDLIPKSVRTSIKAILKICEDQEKDIILLKSQNGISYFVHKQITESDYISKDKVKEKIRAFKSVKQEIFRLESKLGIPSITYDIVRNDYCEKMLEDLLKE